MNSNTYKEKTGSIYGSLFTNYNQRQFEESVELFFTRHKRWGIDLEWFKGKKCLDAGCGGGRFVVALAKLGASEVRGIDISADAAAAASERVQQRGLGDRVQVQQGSVLELPYPGRYFDYVVSSGVIHHTPDPKKAFGELVRVLRPRGKLFLSVYGKGGLKWFVNDIFRYTICKILTFKALELLFKLVGIPANKRYNILDNLYVPYCCRYKESEVRKWLTDAGFTNLRRVTFERYDS
jgi:ubiquinone/menaquinone biosynthesis C-methylase UbiE